MKGPNGGKPLSRRFAPRMSELLAFEAAARHGSFTRAALELHLTQGAVSRSVDMLEQRMRIRLFERVRQRIFLTDAGRSYLAEVSEALRQIDRASHRAMASPPGAEVLNLAVLPTFATHWLIERIPQFQKQCPNVVVNLVSRIRPFSLEAEGVDAAIHHGAPSWPGGTVQKLMDESMVPTSSPSYRDGKSLRRPADLARATLIHQSTRPGAWAEWHRQAGLSGRAAYRGPTYDQFGMAAAAAAAGIGVALLPAFLVEMHIAQGKLVRLFDPALLTSSAYYIVLPDTGAKPIAVRFADWLSGMAHASAAR
jgi:LysR family glycine cleavage system transcriptional activator